MKNSSGTAGAKYSSPYPGMEEFLGHSGREVFELPTSTHDLVSTNGQRGVPTMIDQG